MFKHVDYIMVVVSDMNRSVEFYRDRLGFELKIETPDWTEFKTGETTLALHGGGVPQTLAKADRNGTKYAGTSSIGFSVEDLEKTYTELQTRGVQFVMPPAEQKGEGIKLAVCLDPDGLPIAFAQTINR